MKIILLSFLLFSTGFNQGIEIKTGVKAGGVMSQLIEEKLSFSSPKIGLTGGLFVKTKFLMIFGIQPEILYFPKAGANEGNVKRGDTLYTTKVTTSMQYLEIPLLFKFFAPGFITSEPHLLVGPYYGRMLSKPKFESQCTKLSGFNVGQCPDSVANSIANTDRWDEEKNAYGVVVGGGIDFSLGTFDIRYTVGLSDITKGREKAIRTGTAAILFGFMY